MVKRTLLICEKYPLPEHFGGGMRTMHFVRFFSGSSEIDIAYSGSREVGSEQNNPFSKEYLLELMPIQQGYRQHLRKFGRRIPHPIREYAEGSRRLLTSLIQSRRYDYIFVRRYVSAGNLTSLWKEERQKVIIDFDDVVSGALYASHFYLTRNVAKKFLRLMNRKLLSRYEKRCLKFGAALFCSEKDAARVAGSGKDNVFVVPNIYDGRLFAEYEFGEGFGKENNILFLGSLDYDPNIEGLKWFVKSIYGKFRMRNQKAKLRVVGKRPTSEVRRLCSDAGIELEPDVPDVKESYRKSGVVIVPVLTGGGTRIKILEAALAGRPVMSTPMGADGLDLRDGSEIMLFENSNEFFSKHEMLREREKYNFIAENAKSAVSSKYSKEVFDNSMWSVMTYLDH
jgi:polysaccharide biosynthesis protein PslH